jgi:hypothetical protein
MFSGGIHVHTRTRVFTHTCIRTDDFDHRQPGEGEPSFWGESENDGASQNAGETAAEGPFCPPRTMKFESQEPH